MCAHTHKPAMVFILKRIFFSSFSAYFHSECFVELYAPYPFRFECDAELLLTHTTIHFYVIVRANSVKTNIFPLKLKYLHLSHSSIYTYSWCDWSAFIMQNNSFEKKKTTETLVAQKKIQSFNPACFKSDSYSCKCTVIPNSQSISFEWFGVIVMKRIYVEFCGGGGGEEGFFFVSSSNDFR